MTPTQVRAAQQALATVPGVTIAVDGAWGPQSQAALLAVVARAGGQPIATALPDGYLAMLAKIESGGRPYVKAATSSASGLYQFIRSTWIGEGGTWGDRDGLAFGGLQPSIAEQDARATSFTLKNARALEAAGVKVNRASLYAAHFLGVGTAIKVLGAAITARADALAGQAATRANPSILQGKTVGEFLHWLERKTA